MNNINLYTITASPPQILPRGKANTPNNDPNIWRTKQGESIPICNMRTQHIQYAIKLVEKNYKMKIERLEKIINEHEQKKDFKRAEYILNLIFSKTIEDFCPQYPTLLAELDKRDDGEKISFMP